MAEEPRLEQSEDVEVDLELQSRRDFLIGLKKWSAVVIGGAVLGALLAQDEARAGGAWVNHRGGYGGGAWANRGGAWVNGHAGWVNSAIVGGGSWVNGSGGGGAWVNRRGYGGGAWVNR
jgi:hypothetical protein